MNKLTRKLKKAKPHDKSLKEFANEMAKAGNELSEPATDWLARKASPPVTEVTHKYKVAGGGKNDPRPRPGRRRGWSRS